MGKRKWLKNLTAAAVLFMLPVSGLPVSAANGSCDIEQISLQMPEITMYYRADKPESEYEAYLGGEALEYESTSLFKDTGEGVDYYLMLDVSASIPVEQFENIKSGICDFITKRGEKDKCILIAFGNESKVVLDGSEKTDEACTVVQGLKNEDMETVLFQSVVQAAGMIEKAAQSEEKRRVIITITDGEDCVTGKATEAEAVKTLNDKGIPLYALAVDVGKEEYINNFGEMARNTGGALSIYADGDSRIVFDQIKNNILGSYKAVFRNATNEVSNSREDFTVKFLKHKTSSTREVIPTRWIPDTEPPTVENFEKTGDKEIAVLFSEPVRGADVQGNYKVEKDGEPVSVDSVVYEDGASRAVLTFDETLYTGKYTVSFSNIADKSMEKNALTGSSSFSIAGVEPPKKEKTFAEKWLIPILASSVLMVILIVAVICIIYRKIKKNKGVIYVDGKAALASNVDVKQHVSVKSLPVKNIKFILSDRLNGKCEMNITINGSVIVGRSDECDVYFDDLKMSRQHFALETDGTDVYITDLESRNGTFVNGVRVNQRRKLLPEDEIAAGNIQTRIRW